METRSVAPMRIAKTGYIIMSLVFCLGGILLIVLPELSASVVGRSIGIAMILFGSIKLVGYFSKDLFRLAFQYDLAFGILLLALGTIVLLRTDEMISFLCIALGVSILADGLFKMQIAVDSKKFGIRVWWLIFLLAVLTGLVGLLLMFRPADSVRVLMILLGISLLAEGFLNLCVAVSTVKIIRHQQPDVPETDWDMEKIKNR